MKQLLFLLLIISESLAAQEEPAGKYLYPFQKDGKYGYINKTGDMVVPPMYEKADYFYDGLAAIKSKGKIGFINSVNKIVVSTFYSILQMLKLLSRLVHKSLPFLLWLNPLSQSRLHIPCS